MTENLNPIYTSGTHRLVDPEQTLARITPLLPEFGITRCADVTGLDADLGVPTWCAIRPGALVLQTSNGKGLTDEAARVSALMEAIELYHAENPIAVGFQRACLADLRRRSQVAVVPVRDAADRRFHFDDHSVFDWAQARCLISDETLWLPASAAWFIEPTIYRTHTNGLASGNHLVEATLHGLYELIERDAVSQLVVEGELQIRDSVRVVDTDSVDDGPLAHVIEKIHRAGTKLVLMLVSSCIPVATFWAVLLDKRPYHAVSTLTIGYGTHMDPVIAATRAVTEAVQSRLTVIHGAREDIVDRPVFRRGESVHTGKAYTYFQALVPDAKWCVVVGEGEGLIDRDLGVVLRYVLKALAEAGHDRVFRVDLTRPEFGIPVIKMIVPSLGFERELF